jgi:hypothetical protein
MKRILINGTVVNGFGNLRLIPSTNSFGPFVDGRHYSEGSVRTSKLKFLGYYELVSYNTGLTVLKITI